MKWCLLVNFIIGGLGVDLKCRSNCEDRSSKVAGSDITNVSFFVFEDFGQKLFLILPFSACFNYSARR
jgi:hypothetical protein